MMQKHDAIIAALVDALDIIARAADKPNQQAYIQGVAEQAIRNANIERVRNTDGYLIVKG